jgi:hypothetical protein
MVRCGSGRSLIVLEQYSPMEALVLCIFALSLRRLVRHELVFVLEGPQTADRFFINSVTYQHEEAPCHPPGSSQQDEEVGKQSAKPELSTDGRATARASGRAAASRSDIEVGTGRT